MTSSPLSQETPSSQLTPDEQVNAMVRIGVPREKAERTVRGELRETEVSEAKANPPVTFPIRIVLPWSALCSDNERERPYLVMVKGTPSPRRTFTARYKSARDKTKEIAKQVMAGHSPLAIPLRLVANVYVPNNSLHDTCNFAKGCHDALQRIVYVDDSWLHDTRWIRAGIDVDRPRAELTITPL